VSVMPELCCCAALTLSRDLAKVYMALKAERWIEATNRLEEISPQQHMFDELCGVETKWVLDSLRDAVAKRNREKAIKTYGEYSRMISELMCR